MRQITNSDDFSNKILEWHAYGGRHDLPWQKNQNAYRVWLSEIMLQQTQVKTVISYFKKFIHHYPTISSLAVATSDEILGLWAGLGYYSRARNLQKTAKIIAYDYNGRFPKTIEALTILPGIGRSTAGAILALAFQKPASILDGNVKRVLARYHAIKGWTGESKVQNRLWELSEIHTPLLQIRNYTQAIMDLGATICTRTAPSCACCPVKDSCVAFKDNSTSEFPNKKPKQKSKQENLYFVVIKNNKNEVALAKRPSQGIWGGLWCFPEKSETENLNAALALVGRRKAKSIIKMDSFHHKLSHIDFKIFPVVVGVTGKTKAIGPIAWHKLGQELTVGVPKPVNKIIDKLVAPNGKLVQ